MVVVLFVFRQHHPKGDGGFPSNPLGFFLSSPPAPGKWEALPRSQIPCGSWDCLLATTWCGGFGRASVSLAWLSVGFLVSLLLCLLCEFVFWCFVFCCFLWFSSCHRMFSWYSVCEWHSVVSHFSLDLQWVGIVLPTATWAASYRTTTILKAQNEKSHVFIRLRFRICVVFCWC